MPEQRADYFHKNAFNYLNNYKPNKEITIIPLNAMIKRTGLLLKGGLRMQIKTDSMLYYKIIVPMFFCAVRPLLSTSRPYFVEMILRSWAGALAPRNCLACHLHWQR